MISTNLNEILSLDEKSKTVTYLGYQVKLTKAECALLSLLQSENRCIDLDELCHRLSVKTVSVHVCNLNNKLRKIGGRPVVVFQKPDGYKITDEL